LKKAPIQARDEAQTGRLGEECNNEWRFFQPVPFGLRPKRPCAALRSLAGGTTPAAFRALRMTFLIRNAS
jgi:hypothetical protein